MEAGTKWTEQVQMDGTGIKWTEQVQMDETGTKWTEQVLNEWKYLSVWDSIAHRAGLEDWTNSSSQRTVERGL